jgi:hypothetical protein
VDSVHKVPAGDIWQEIGSLFAGRAGLSCVRRRLGRAISVERESDSRLLLDHGDEIDA